MRILFITPNSPAIPKTGSEQRSALLLQGMTQVAEVDTVVIAWEEIDLQQMETLQETCKDVTLLDPYGMRKFVQKIISKLTTLAFLIVGRCYTPYNSCLYKKIKIILEKKTYDFVVVRYLATARYVNAFSFPNVIVDVDDLPSESYWTSVVRPTKGWLQKSWGRYKWRCIQRETERDIAKCRHAWFANRQHVIWSNASHLPNIPFFLSQIDESNCKTPSFKEREDEKIILFVGLMCYQPNVDAMNFFVESVWPKIIAVFPLAKLRIAGRNPRPENIARWSVMSNVAVLGFVEDLETEYIRASVVVAPIFSGSGTNIKVIEAMAYGKPCVASTFAGKGFEDFLRDGENIVFADNAENFARQTNALLETPQYAALVAKAAKETIYKNFNVAQFNKTVSVDLFRLFCSGGEKSHESVFT